MSFPVFVTHVDGGTETIAAAHINSLNDAAVILNKYDFPIGAETTVTGGEVLLRFVCPRALRLPANLAGSAGSATVAPTATATFAVRRRAAGATGYATVATFGFDPGTAPRPATLSAQAAADFAAGDELSVVAPATADSTLAQWSFTLACIYP